MPRWQMWILKKLGVKFGPLPHVEWPPPPPRETETIEWMDRPMGIRQHCLLCGAPVFPGIGTPHMPDCVYYDGPLEFIIRRTQ